MYEKVSEKHKSVKQKRLESGERVLVETRVEHNCWDCEKVIPARSNAWQQKSNENSHWVDRYTHEPACMSIGDLMRRGLEDAKKENN